MDASIRPAAPADINGLLAIEETFRAEGTSPWQVLDRYTFERKTAHGEVLVAAIDDAVIGYLTWTYLWSYPWIEYVRVLQAHRRRGVGRALEETLEQRLRADGFSHLYSSRTGDEEGSVAFHRALGFRQCGRIRWIWPTPDEIVMIKGLEEI